MSLCQQAFIREEITHVHLCLGFCYCGIRNTLKGGNHFLKAKEICDPTKRDELQNILTSKKCRYISNKYVEVQNYCSAWCCNYLPPPKLQKGRISFSESEEYIETPNIAPKGLLKLKNAGSNGWTLKATQDLAAGMLFMFHCFCFIKN